MFKLETGMVVEFCDGDIGIVIDDYIMCSSCYVSFDNVSMKDMFGDNTDCCAVNTVYKSNIPHTFEDLKYITRNEECIVWQRKAQLKEGDVFICTNIIAAGLYHVDVISIILKLKMVL